MRVIALLGLMVSFNIILSAQEDTSFTDKRDGKIYKIVKIGNQIWMAENLAYNCGYNSGIIKSGGFTIRTELNDSKSDSVCWIYRNDLKRLKYFGYMYNWESAKNVGPPGWKLPTVEDFEKLLNNVGKNKKKRYYSLRSGGASGFTATFGGWYRPRVGYTNEGQASLYWSSSSDSKTAAWSLHIYGNYQKAVTHASRKDFGIYVRCLKND